MAHILIIEDDTTLSGGLVMALGSHHCDQGYTLTGARELLARNSYDLIVLDVNLPDGNGMDFFREIQSLHIPVIFLTANDLDTDIVRGLELGAEDYITKPFSLPVLRARVQTQLRKVTAGYQQDGFQFDFENCCFARDGQEVDLSKPEQILLKTLVQNKNHTVLRDTLIQRIWGNSLDSVEENALSVTVKRLRSKLGADHIKTVYGLGYQWRDEV